MALLGEVPIGETVKISGYAEADFLNRPPSAPFRWRQYYGKFEWGSWEVLAGQAWSFLRPNRLGISSEGDLMNTRIVDAGYHVGLLGSRKRQVRVVRRMGAWQAGLSYENGRDFLPKLVHDSKRAHLEFIGLAGRGDAAAPASPAWLILLRGLIWSHSSSTRAAVVWTRC